MARVKRSNRKVSNAFFVLERRSESDVEMCNRRLRIGKRLSRFLPIELETSLTLQ